ncbi:uncharacterized protein LOC113352315 [Papaver somniferum]|uniref:uncharacterized protein LOC113352315 n=1 Tax=Papaver somniferum TaxID=3469 RepID=UPI000E6F8297|nr:uncharacterized protein LOC113352315 [Papaver somniferum]
MDFKVVGSKSIIAQVSELLFIVNHLKDTGIELASVFVFGVIISRLPPSWNGYEKKLKHDETDYDLKGLQRHFRIEDDSRKREIKDSQKTENLSKVNYVDALKPKNDTQFKKKHPSKKNKGDCYFLQAANSVSNNESGWWYDNGSTVHICRDRHLYKTYEAVTGEGNEVVSANNLHIKVIGKGTVELSFTSGKTVTLTNVLHVPGIVKNLVSGELVMNAGFKTYGDVGDLKNHMTRGGNKYYVTFNDDYIRYVYTYLMKSKDYVFDMFKIYKAEVETQLGFYVLIVQTNEYDEHSAPTRDTEDTSEIIEDIEPKNE